MLMLRNAILVSRVVLDEGVTSVFFFRVEHVGEGRGESGDDGAPSEPVYVINTGVGECIWRRGTRYVSEERACSGESRREILELLKVAGAEVQAE